MKKKPRADDTDVMRPWLSLGARTSWLIVQELMKERRT